MKKGESASGRDRHVTRRAPLFVEDNFPEATRAFGESVLDALIEAGARDDWSTRRAASTIWHTVEYLAIRPLESRKARDELRRLQDFAKSIATIRSHWRFLAYDRYRIAGLTPPQPIWQSRDFGNEIEDALTVLDAAQADALAEASSERMQSAVRKEKKGGAPEKEARQRAIRVGRLVAQEWYDATGDWPGYSGEVTNHPIFKLITKHLLERTAPLDLDARGLRDGIQLARRASNPNSS